MKAVGDGDVRLDFALEGGFAMTGLLYRLQGRFVVNGYDGKVPWTNQQMVLSTIVPPPALASTDPGEQHDEFEKFLETPEGKVWQRAHRSYEVEIDSDGAFKIEEVPEGSYQLAGHCAANAGRRRRADCRVVDGHRRARHRRQDECDDGFGQC